MRGTAERIWTIQEYDDALNKIEAENKRLKEFACDVIEQECWSIFPLDGGDLQELAEKLGLIVSCIVTEEDLKDMDEDFDFDVGDPFYKFSDMLKGIEPMGNYTTTWILVEEEMPTDTGYILRYSTKTGVLSATYWANTNSEAEQLKKYYTHWKSETLPKGAKL